MNKIMSSLVATAVAFTLIGTGVPATANTVGKAAYDVSAYYRVDLGYMVGWKTPTNRVGITGYTVVSVPDNKTCVVRGATATTCTFPAATFGYSGIQKFVVRTTNGTAVVGTSVESNAVSAASIPVAPLAVGAEVVSDTAIRVAWVPSANTGGASLYGYKVTYWKSDRYGNPVNATKSEVVVSETSVLLESLDVSTMYIINVASCNAYGCNSADRWSYTATTPTTSAVTSIVLPKNVYGGSASTTCFDEIFDAVSGEIVSSGVVCGSVIADPTAYPVIDSTATAIVQSELATKFRQTASLSGFAKSYSIKSWAPAGGLSWFAHLRATSKSVTLGFTTDVVISSSTNLVCSVEGSKIVFKSPGTCSVSALVRGNSVFLDSPSVTARFIVTN
jgi:hypothetical protein